MAKKETKKAKKGWSSAKAQEYARKQLQKANDILTETYQELADERCDVRAFRSVVSGMTRDCFASITDQMKAIRKDSMADKKRERIEALKAKIAKLEESL